MTRFIYVADTHWGAAQMGYRQQPWYPERLPDFWRALQPVCVVNRNKGAEHHR